MTESKAALIILDGWGIGAGDGWVGTVESALQLRFVRPPPTGAIR